MRIACFFVSALDHEADIAKVQEWLGHANIATTRLYNRRQMQPLDSPTFKVAYEISLPTKIRVLVNASRRQVRLS